MDNEARELARKTCSILNIPFYDNQQERDLLELFTTRDNLIRAGVKLAAASSIDGQHYLMGILANKIRNLTTADEQAALDALLNAAKDASYKAGLDTGALAARATLFNQDEVDALVKVAVDDAVRNMLQAYVSMKGNFDDAVNEKVLVESEWWHPHAAMHNLDYQEQFGKNCPCIKCKRLAANRARVKGEPPMPQRDNQWDPGDPPEVNLGARTMPSDRCTEVHGDFGRCLLELGHKPPCSWPWRRQEPPMPSEPVPMTFEKWIRWYKKKFCFSPKHRDVWNAATAAMQAPMECGHPRVCRITGIYVSLRSMDEPEREKELLKMELCAWCASLAAKDAEIAALKGEE